MSMDKWNAVKQPPKWALRKIEAGRLKGKSDISPQWRYQAMTEVYGLCGFGWAYTVDRLWTEPGSDNQVFAFAQVSLYVKHDNEWSAAIPGSGGHMLIIKEKAGLHANDEGYKMAITDALSTAMKMIGVAADIYAGHWDGSKYRNGHNAASQPHTEQQAQHSGQHSEQQPKSQNTGAHDPILASMNQLKKLATVMTNLGIEDREAKLNQVNTWLENKGFAQVSSSKELTRDQAMQLIDDLESIGEDPFAPETQEEENATANE